MDNPQLCIGISGSEHKAGIWDCTRVHDQRWHLGSELGTSGYYQFINDNNECLAVAGGSTAAGAQIVGYTCLGSQHEDQYWAFDPTGEGYYWINDYKSGYMVSVAGGVGGIHNSADVVQWPWKQNKHDDQVWERQAA